MTEEATGEFNPFAAPAPGANESPGLLDLGKKAISDTIGLAAGGAAAGQYAAAQGGAPNAHEFAGGLNQVLNYYKRQLDESMSPGAKDALENSRNHLVGATLLAAMGVIPQAAVMVGAGAVGGPVGVAGAGAGVQVSQDIDAAVRRFNELTDEDLKKQSPVYREMRDGGKSETTARMDLTNMAYSYRQFGTSAAIGAAQFVMANRLLPGSGASVGRTVAGVTGDIAANAVGGAVGAVSTDYADQASGIMAGMSRELNFQRILDEGLKGGLLGGLLGSVGTAAHVVGNRRQAARDAAGKPTDGDTPAPDVVAAIQQETPPTAPVEAPPAKAAGEATTQPEVAPEVAAAINPPAPDRTPSDARAVAGGGMTRSPSDNVPGRVAPPVTPEGNPQVPPQVADATERTRAAQDIRPQDLLAEPEEMNARPMQAPQPVADAAQRVRQAQDEGLPEPLRTPEAVAVRPEEAAAPRVDDAGQNIPEQPRTLDEQLQKVVAGETPAVMVPSGTPVTALLRATAKENDLKQIKTPKGTFFYDPAQLTAKQIMEAVKNGRENDILGLGPYDKTQVAQRMAEGERPLAAVERSPDGVEVKAALGTEGTITEQVRALDQNRTPGNTVAVESPQKVVADRRAGPRILPDLVQQKKETAERLAAERKLAKADTEAKKGNRGLATDELDMKNVDNRRKFLRDAKAEFAKGAEAAEWARDAAKVPLPAKGKKFSDEVLAQLQAAHRKQVEAARTAPKEEVTLAGKRQIKKAEQEAARAKETPEQELARLIAEQKKDESNDRTFGFGTRDIDLEGSTKRGRDALDQGEAVERTVFRQEDEGDLYDRVGAETARETDADTPRRLREDDDAPAREAPTPKESTEERLTARRAEGYERSDGPTVTRQVTVEKVKSRKIGPKGAAAIAKAKRVEISRQEAMPGYDPSSDVRLYNKMREVSKTLDDMIASRDFKKYNDLLDAAEEMANAARNSESMRIANEFERLASIIESRSDGRYVGTYFRRAANNIKASILRNKSARSLAAAKERNEIRQREEQARNRARQEKVSVGDNVNKQLGALARDLVELVPTGKRIIVADPKDFDDIVVGWKKLGVVADVSMERHRQAVMRGDLNGFVVHGDDHAIIMVNPKMPKHLQIETFAHEYGHVIEKTLLNKAQRETPDIVKQIREEHFAWATEQFTNGTIRSNIDTLRSYGTAKTTRRASAKAGMNIDVHRAKFTPEYWRSFSEWFADNVAKWATTEREPLSIVEKYFSRVAAAYKRIWARLTGRNHMPAESVRKWLNDKMHERGMREMADFVTSEGNIDASYTLPQVRQQLAEGRRGFSSAFSAKMRSWKDATSTMSMLAQRAETFFTNDAPRRVAEGVEAMRVNKDRILNREGGGNEVVRDLADLERRYAATGEWKNAVDVAYDATIHNVNPNGKNEHLGKDKTGGWQAKARLADINRRFNALPEDLRAGIEGAAKYFRDTQNEMALNQIKTILDAAGIKEPGLAERIHTKGLTDDERKGLDKKFKTTTIIRALDDAAELKQIEGMYFPLRRHGDYVVTGERPLEAVSGSVKVAPDTLRFADLSDTKARRAARSYVQAPDSLTHSGTKKVWVDKNDHTKVLTEDDVNAIPAYDVQVQAQHTEFHQSLRDAERARQELADNGLTMQGVREKRENPQGRGNELMTTQMATIVRSLEQRDKFRNMSAAQKNDVIQALNEASIRLKAGGRIQSRMLPRRRVSGFDRDMVRNTAEYASQSASYLSRLQHMPAVEAALKDMRDQIEAGKYAKEDDGTALRRDEVIREMETRAYGDVEIKPTTANNVIRRALQLSMLDKLAGVSYHIINSVEPWTTSLPVISGKHGIGATTRALTAAYDLIGGRGALGAGFRDLKKAFREDSGFTDYPTRFKNEMAKTGMGKEEFTRLGNLLDTLYERGLLDREAGMEVQMQGKPDSNIAGRALDRAELMARQVGTALEAINRSVTGIAAYQLEYKRTKNHEAAMRYAVDTVHDTMGNYSHSNAAPIFNHPLGRIALQFKKFGQKTYYLLGKTFQGMIAGDKVAARQFVGLMMTHALAAGALGLPLEPIKIALTVANALGTTTMSYDDFEAMVRRGSAAVLGTTGGELFSRGVARAAGIDISSRISLASLVTMGAPRSEKKQDIMAWLAETAMGAPGGTIMQQVEGIQALSRGDLVSAADKMIPLKAARDLQRSVTGFSGGRTDRSGRETLTPYTPYEAALRALGFAPQREAESGEQRRAYNAAVRDSQRTRQDLTNAWVQATPAERLRIWGKVEQYNAALPVGAHEARITRRQLDQTLANRQREKRDEREVSGMRINRRTQHIYDQYDIYNN